MTQTVLREGPMDDWIKRMKDKILGPEIKREPFSFKPEDTKKLEVIGQKINSTIFAPGAELHAALRANPAFKDNLEKMLIDFLTDVRNRIVNLPTDKLQALQNNPPSLLTDLELRAAFLGHLPPTELPPEFRTLVGNLIKAQQKNFALLLKAFLEMAIKERASGSESSSESFQILANWGKQAVRLIDRLQFPSADKTQKKAKQQVGQEEQPPSIFKDLESAHEAGAQALKRALDANPNLSSADQRRIYDRASAAAIGSAGR